jgi:acyl-coenzyme A thioesterase PaaI-like protein
LQSYPSDDGSALVATVVPDDLFNPGAPNVMYGGHVASLLDCHSIWTAIAFAYRTEGRPLGTAPRVAYVTRRLSVDYLRPTPLDREIHLRAWVEGDVGRRTTVRSELGPAGDTTATADVVAVRVDPSDVRGHHQGDAQSAE